MELTRKMVQENTRIVQGQDEHKAKKRCIAERHEKVGKRLAEVDKENTSHAAKRSEYVRLLRLLDNREQLLTDLMKPYSWGSSIK